MSNNLFISYDLYSPGQDYSAVIEGIKSLGGWAKVHKRYGTCHLLYLLSKLQMPFGQKWTIMTVY